MKYCAKCRNPFPDDIHLCPIDGETLNFLEVNSEALTLTDVRKASALPSDEDTQPIQAGKTGDGAKFNAGKLIGKTIDGKYLVQDLLGMGGMGAVFRARHTFINNEVAIKVINPRYGDSAEMAERFLREARAATMIDHPNAVKVTDFGCEGDMLYLVMEFIQGRSLANIIRKEGTLKPVAAAILMRQICAALDEAHASSVIHRDLKPDNIMIKENTLGEPVVKVLDFGLAKVATGESHRLTSAGVVLGTLSYMSPEQCRGDEKIDPRSDIYSLGIMAFEMLTGKLPFTAPTHAGLLTQHIMKEPPKLRSYAPEIPYEVEAVVLKAMEKDPDARYRSAGDFAVELCKAAQCPDNSPKAADLFDASARNKIRRQMVRRAGPNSTDEGVPQGGSDKGALQFANLLDAAHIQSVGTSFAASINRRSFLLGAAATLIVTIGAGFYLLNSNEVKAPSPPGSQSLSDDGMALIKGGWLNMGSEEGFDEERPVHDVYIDSFYIDETEVTNEQFAKFVKATEYETDAEKLGDAMHSWKVYATPDRNDHPVVSVSWNDAIAYANWAGKRLPTEAEWEYSARGGLIGKKYPWGDDSPTRRANFDLGQKIDIPPTQPVKSYEPNGYGLYNMAGNVSEWCMDWYNVNYYQKSPERNSQGPNTGNARVIRGGSWYTDFKQLRVASRYSEPPAGYEYHRGFRCAKSK